MFESLKVFFINKVAIFMMSAKWATVTVLEVRLFWNKVYDVRIFVYGVISRILWRELTYIVDSRVTEVWYLKHFYERSHYNLNFTWFGPEKPSFFRVFLAQLQLFGNSTRYDHFTQVWQNCWNWNSEISLRGMSPDMK